MWVREDRDKGRPPNIYLCKSLPRKMVFRACFWTKMCRFPYLLCSAILFISLLGRARGQGTFKNCCAIAKCSSIRDACKSATKLVLDQSCEQTCLSDVDLSLVCNSAESSSLQSANYSCFGPFLEDVASQPLKLNCDPTFSETSPATPDLPVTYGFCCENCGGWSVSVWNKPAEWATPLLQYILPGR